MISPSCHMAISLLRENSVVVACLIFVIFFCYRYGLVFGALDYIYMCVTPLIILLTSHVNFLSSIAFFLQGYKIIGSHSGVKLCRWTKAQLRGRGGCYKHSFYGIESHR